MAKTLTKFGGVPAGGSDGQVLTKQSGTDHDVAFETPAGGGGSGYPSPVIETGDFQIDPDVHLDGCVIHSTGGSGAYSSAYITLPALGDQPSPGYHITILRDYQWFQFRAADTTDLTSPFTAQMYVELFYLGSNVWGYWVSDNGLSDHITNQ